MLTTTILAAAQEPERGWGGPIALFAAVAAFYVIISVHHRVQEARERRANPSPTPPGRRGVSDTTQARTVSDTADTERDTGWWGRIATIGGKRVRVIEGIVEHVDEAVDVALDDDEPAEDEEEAIEDVVDRLEYRGVAYSEIVATLMADFKVSEATAKRRIRDARAAREQVS
ncbi:hypothetical protein GA0074692_6853 [Micromonospora pallida]|uniref:Uncharacterized protein n=1 Tax=Micromonospora pallida TaxID=145854 RepID=A0A1C6TKU4_9ACTN|nr:hypothetical protein [Micromonospora pallida]SCL42183.1 hypothetical protein GA0074692_6698 [Micromonospora pallida]SCL43381.1 hypothetical protein GA0074692_6853 [Micromonospora pallida]